MPRLPVTVLSPIEGAGLVAALDGPELSVRERTPRRHGYPYGANLDSLVILDLDEDHALGHIEILDEVSLWTERKVSPPSARTTAGRLAVAADAIEVLVDEQSPCFWFDRDTGLLLIEMEQAEPASEWVLLSPAGAGGVWAYATAGCLGGFLITVP